MARRWARGGQRCRASPTRDKSQGTAAPWQRRGPRGGDTHARTGLCFCRAHRKHFLEIPPVWARAAGTALGPLPGKQVPGKRRPRGGRPLSPIPKVGGTTLGNFIPHRDKVDTKGSFLILPRGWSQARGRAPRRCHQPYSGAPRVTPMGTATPLSPRWPPRATSQHPHLLISHPGKPRQHPYGIKAPGPAPRVKGSPELPALKARGDATPLPSHSLQPGYVTRPPASKLR